MRRESTRRTDAMNPVEAIISLTRYKAPLNAIPPEEHDHWRQYLQRGPDQERKENQEILTAFRMLNSEQAETLAHYALDLHNERQNTDNFLSCQILTQIASFVDGGLQSVYADILKRHITFLPALYRGADASARDALISIIQTFERDDYDFGRLVDGLAWIGDDIVQQQIVRWRQHPPDWRSSHYINFDQFEIEAGWELTKEGRRRDLYFS
jgi:hypothetical protein